MLLKINDADINPKTSVCTRSRIPLDLCSLLGKETLACFLSMHPLHTLCCSMLNIVILVTISLGIGKTLWCSLFCYNSHKMSMLWTRAQTGSPCNLHKFPSLTSITWVEPRLDSFGFKRTCWFLNSTTKLVSSMTETETKFFLRSRTNNTLSKSKDLPDWRWKWIMPTSTTRYLASSPSST